jgi:hypothetical protein
MLLMCVCWRSWGGNNHTHMSFVSYSAYKPLYHMCIVASSQAPPAPPTGIVQLCPCRALVSPLAALALPPASRWLFAIVALALLGWRLCHCFAVVIALVTLASAQSQCCLQHCHCAWCHHCACHHCTRHHHC